MKPPKYLLLLLIGFGMGFLASILYAKVSSRPNIGEPEHGGVSSVSFWSAETLRPVAKPLPGNMMVYEATTDWNFRNNTDKDIELAIPRQKYWIMYDKARTLQGVVMLGSLEELPEECLREEAVTLRPKEKLVLSHLREVLFTRKPEVGLNDEIRMIVKIGREYHTLSCRNRTSL